MRHLHRVRIHVSNGAIHFTQMRSAERTARRVKLIDDRGGVKDISCARHRLVLYLLRAKIRLVLQLLRRRLRQQVLVAQQAKIQQLERAIGQNLDVVRIQKMVANAFAVRVIQRRQKLLGHLQHFAHLRLALGHKFLEVLPLNEFRRHENRKVFVAAGMQLGDIWMVQRARGFGLRQYFLDQIVRVVQPLRDLKLAQRDGPVLLRISGLMDYAYASPWQFLDQLKAGRARSGSRAAAVALPVAERCLRLVQVRSCRAWWCGG